MAPYTDMLAEKPGMHEVTAAFGFHDFEGVGELGVHEIVIPDRTARQNFHIRFELKLVRDRLRLRQAMTMRPPGRRGYLWKIGRKR